MSKKIFSKNFVMLIIGQTLSMFGSNIIRFVLSLYILEVTQSAAVYGTVIAITYIPPIFLSPLGGVLADRSDRKKLMVLLDMIYCVITLSMGVLFQNRGDFKVTAILLIILSMIFSLEGPVSQTCVPMIQNKENLTKANAISGQISSLSGLLAPLLASFLYSFIGAYKLHFIMYICAFFFSFAAAVEVFLKIPRQKLEHYATVAQTIKYDLKGIFQLAFRERKYIGETMLLNALLMFLVSPYLSMGITYLISVRLGLSAIWNGCAQVMIGIATIFGGMVATVIAPKFKIDNLYKILAGMGIPFIFIGLAMCEGLTSKVAFGLVSVSSAVILFLANIAGVFIISGMQRACPKNMLGRLMSLFNALNNLTLPVGIWLHGIIYEKCDTMLPVAFLIIAFLSVMGGLRGKKVYVHLTV